MYQDDPTSPSIQATRAWTNLLHLRAMILPNYWLQCSALTNSPWRFTHI